MYIEMPRMGLFWEWVSYFDVHPLCKHYLVVVDGLVAVVFALVRPNKKVHFVILQKLFGHVRAEVGPGAPQRVSSAAPLVPRIAPQDVKDLKSVTFKNMYH